MCLPNLALGDPLKYLYVYHVRVTKDFLQSSTTNSCRCTRHTFDKHNKLTMLLYKFIAEYLLSAYSLCIVYIKGLPKSGACIFA